MKRVIVAIVAVLLAGTGALLMLRYGATADARALAGVQTTRVLVVTRSVPAGTPVEQIAGSLAVKAIPRSAVVDGAIGDLTGLVALRGRQTAATLSPGQQLVPGLFLSTQNAGDGSVSVPKGMHEVSVRLDPQRADGGRLQTGDLVGVTISQEVNNVNQTQLVLTKVLVTDVRNLSATGSGTDTKTGQAPSSTTEQMISVALPDDELQRFVFGVEHGTIWLSKETPDTKDSRQGVTDTKSVYR